MAVCKFCEEEVALPCLSREEAIEGGCIQKTSDTRHKQLQPDIHEHALRAIVEHSRVKSDEWR